MADNVTIDHVLNLTVDAESFANEIRTLTMLTVGLGSIGNSLAVREREKFSSHPDIEVFNFSASGNPDLDFIACLFHWFGVSVCNYARLVGYIDAVHRGAIKRESPAQSKDVTREVNTYVTSVYELSEVLKWRNKVAGHFAITDPRKDDNLATLEASVMFPVAWDRDRYRLNTMVFGKSYNGQFERSELPIWSITEVYETISKRYWPVVPVTSDETTTG